MKFSLNWLNKWIELPTDHKSMFDALAMHGLVVDNVEKFCSNFSGVKIGKIISKHVLSELNGSYLYQVNIGENNQGHLKIVSNENNIYENDCVAIALLDSSLQAGIANRQNAQDIISEGMICLEHDLGLSDKLNVVKFPINSPIGEDVYKWLDDTIVDLDVMPNRSDCFSVRGLARELSVIFNKKLLIPVINKFILQDDQTIFKVMVTEPKAAPHFCSRVVSNINNLVDTPMWIQQHLQKSGIRTVNPLVDIANYVMLELGQPMHIYNLDKLNGMLNVRFAKEGESITLLSGQKVTLDPNTLIIADQNAPQALAGIMGGLDSSVTQHTKNILIESAFFVPEFILGRARKYNLQTDSSYRFERGVDPKLAREALEKFCFLVKDILGGIFGPVSEIIELNNSVKQKNIAFSLQNVTKLLGVAIPEKTVIEIFERLGFEVVDVNSIWQVYVPSFRFDINLEVDLIEEIGRVYGYDNITLQKNYIEMSLSPINQEYENIDVLSNCIRSRDYNECITYSFVDPQLQKLLFDNFETIKLLNPISKDWSSMRLSLWPGLLNVAKYNFNRQQPRIRLFEVGMCFIGQDPSQQFFKLAALAYGDCYREQWGLPKKDIDFYDVKKDLECVLATFGLPQHFSFHKVNCKALHPGQCCEIRYYDEVIGLCGALSPEITKHFEFDRPVFLYELDLKLAKSICLPEYKILSKYPIVRRDISLYVSKKVIIQELIDSIKEITCEFVKDLSIFDIYEGKNLGEVKSVAIGLILQHKERTLVEEEINKYVRDVVDNLQKRYDIQLRDKLI